MDDTIYRQAAIAYAISGKTREFEGEKWIRVSEVRESLKTMPSAERQGRWVMNERGIYECSVCGLVPTQEQKLYDRYCSYCGARMDSNTTQHTECVENALDALDEVEE